MKTQVASSTLITCVVMTAMVSLATLPDTFIPLFSPFVMEQAVVVVGPSLSPNIPSRMPKPLPVEERNEPVLLVHVGKAGGSSVRKLANTGRKKCRILTNKTAVDNETAISIPFFCTLGRVTGATNNVAHMWANQRTIQYANYSQYLVPVRNPIDRLISWYKYELYLLNKGSIARKQAMQLVRLVESCSLPDINSVIMNGLMMDEPVNGSATLQPTDNRTDADRKQCQKLAMDCLTGEKRCYAHNYYNFELYMEDLIRWRGECAESHDACNATTGERRDIRIDVVRSEHSESDWKRLLELWTGETNLTSAPILKALQGRSNAASSLKLNGTSQVSQEGKHLLCRSICVELVAYKKAIAMADNLLDEEVEESYRELDETCGMSVDETCGTDFHYRNVKKSKFISRRR